MTALVAGRDRRALAVGAAIIVGAITIRLAVVPYVRAVAATRADIAEQVRMLAAERAVLRSERSLPAGADSALSRLSAVEPLLEPGATAATAQASEADRLERAADAQQVTLSRIEPLPPRPGREGITPIPLRVEGESDFEGILSLLADLEQGRPAATIEDLSLQARTAHGRGSQASAEFPETIEFRLTAVGFIADSASARRRPLPRNGPAPEPVRPGTDAASRAKEAP